MTGAVLRYLLLLPANLVFVALAYLLSPLLALISMATGPVLPGFLQWFSTTDDTLDGGQHQHPEIYPPATGFKLWWQRTCWICRNPAHGWQARVMGFPTEGHSVIFTRMKTGGIQSDGRTFTIKTIMKSASGKTYFSYRSEKKLFGSRYLKVWIGWNPTAYDGVSHQYEFQPLGIKKLP